LAALIVSTKGRICALRCWQLAYAARIESDEVEPRVEIGHRRGLAAQELDS
jgi:hypothetical protein